jgi:hypothetical protein
VGNPAAGGWRCRAGGRLLDVLDFDFDAAEEFGKEIVDGGEDYKEDEAKDAQDNGHEEVNDAHDLDGLGAEDDHGDAYEGVDETHQDVERDRDLARLQNGDSDDLLLHGFWLVEGMYFG